ncbi:MAG: 16S rRNA (cytosine(1402)-N(4))-methyltransferase RsmH, partial [Actinomycetota bacterium]|nr:16S rRNA (cytosine(1402)-N(4))-methyltransferase RsmH [Actinomycetota bacterium]
MSESTPEQVPGRAHVPVLLDRVVQLLAPALARPGAVLVDATVGLGGHCEAVLDRCPQARVVGLDRDPVALELARSRLARFGDRVLLVHAVFDTAFDPETGPDTGAGVGVGINAVLFDLGVSSLQLDWSERGFSYAQDTPLDMRMDASTGPTAADLLNQSGEAQLTRILRTYGEERFAARIAHAIVRTRVRQPFTTSARLVEVVRDSVPAPARRTGGHPAKRTFQALRIAVNDELTVLRRALPAAVDATSVGGRIVVLAYQSLEDRIVKRELTSRARAQVPDDLPVVPEDRAPELRLLTRGAERAPADEVAANPRARSVRLRAAERVRA